MPKFDLKCVDEDLECETFEDVSFPNFLLGRVADNANSAFRATAEGTTDGADVDGKVTLENAEDVKKNVKETLLRELLSAMRTKEKLPADIGVNNENHEYELSAESRNEVFDFYKGKLEYWNKKKAS